MVTALTPASRARVWLAVAAALILAALPAPKGDGAAWAAATRPQPCEQLAASPNFAQDGVAFCSGTAKPSAGNDVVLFVTTDHGRSWRRTTSTGLTFQPGDHVDDVLASPRFSTDRTVFVEIRFEGVFQSTDLGATFTPLLPRATPRLTPFVLGAGVGELPAVDHTVLLAANLASGRPALIDPSTRAVELVAGAPEPAVGAFVSPYWADDQVGLMFTESGEFGMTTVSVFACTVAFECTTLLTRLPAGHGFRQAWAAADFATSRTLFVELRSDAADAPLLFVSRDAGHTFSPLSAAQRILTAHVPDVRKHVPAAVGIAPGRTGSATLWMRVIGSATGSPPYELYRSDDDGRSWRRVAFGHNTQHGQQGTMHALDVPNGPLQPRTLLVATGDKHLLANGITIGGWGAECSSDDGRTWNIACR